MTKYVYPCATTVQCLLNHINGRREIAAGAGWVYSVWAVELGKHPLPRFRALPKATHSNTSVQKSSRPASKTWVSTCSLSRDPPNSNRARVGDGVVPVVPVVYVARVINVPQRGLWPQRGCGSEIEPARRVAVQCWAIRWAS